MLIVCVLAGLGYPAFAFTLGDINIRSYLGEPFLARVSIAIANGEDVDDTCFRILPGKTTTGANSLPATQTKFVLSGSKGILHIRTLEPVNEPVVHVSVEANCPDIGRIQRDYMVLLDPPISAQMQLTTTKSIEPRSPTISAITPPVAETNVEILPGDSVNSVAKRIYPKNRRQWRKLVHEIMTANGLTGKSNAPLPAGTKLIIPDLSSTSRTSASSTIAQPHRQNTPPQSTSKRSVSKRQSPRKVKSQNEGGFRLKLSVSEIDLSNSERMTEQERKALREQQLLMDSDDHAAELLASRNKLKELEARLTDLQLKVSTLAALPTPNTTREPPASTSGTPATTTPVPEEPATVALRPVAKPVLRENMFTRIIKVWYWLGWLILAVIGALLMLSWRRKRSEKITPRRYELQEPTTSKPKTTTFPPAPNTGDLDFDMTPKAPTTSSKDLYRNVIVNQFPELKSAGNTDARTIIGVAWQYFEDRDERSRAIELIEFGLEEHPDVDELWLTQFEFLLRDRRRSAYEQLAKRYRQRFPADQSWIKIQSWIQIQSGGRFLDPENALYAVEAIADNQTKVLSLDFDVSGKSEAAANRPAVAEVNPITGESEVAELTLQPKH